MDVQEALVQAAALGNLRRIRQLIDQGANPNGASQDERPPLGVAADMGRADVVSLLMRCGARVDLPDKEGATPLILASRRWRVDVVVRLLRAGARTETVDRYDKTALAYAVASPGLGLVAQLIKAGARADATDEWGNTVLHAALSSSEAERLPIVRVLIEAGASPVAVDAHGRSPLHLAALRGLKEVCIYLISKGAGVDVWDASGSRPLSQALSLGHVQTAACLIRAGAHAGALPKDTTPPLHSAAAAGRGGATCVELLLSSGRLDVNARGAKGLTALMIAAGRGEVKAVTRLLERGADLAAVNEDGRGALHFAVTSGSKEMALLLLKLGADAKAVDLKGVTPLQLAVRGRAPEAIVAALINAGADPSERMIDGRDLMAAAVDSGRPEVVAALEQRPDPGAPVASGAEPTENQTAAALFAAASRGNLPEIQRLISMKTPLSAEVLTEAFCRAVMAGHEPVALGLTAANLPLNGTVKGGCGLVEWVSGVAPIKARLLKVLIKRGAPIPQGGGVRCSPLIGICGYADYWTPRDRPPVYATTQLQVFDELVTLMVKGGVDVNAVDDRDGQTALMWAARSRLPSTIKVLCEMGARVDAQDRFGRTALMCAASRGDGARAVPVVRALLACGADVGVQCGDGKTAVGYAAHSPQISAILAKVARAKGIAVDVGSGADLVAAAEKGQWELVNKLLRSGVDLEAKNKQGWTALMGAAHAGQRLVVKALLQRGARCDPEEGAQWSALCLAATRGHIDVCRLLIQGGASVNASVGGGRSPLGSAACSNNPALVEMLLDAGAKVNARPSFNTTALMVSASASVYQSRPSVVAARLGLLIQRGADVTVANDDGENALQLALGARAMGRWERESKALVAAVRVLIEARIPLNHKDKKGLTALHHAARHNLHESAQLLLAAGADPHRVDRAGHTALELARRSGAAQVAELLAGL